MGIEDLETARREQDSISEEATSHSLLTNTRCCFCFPCFTSRRASFSSSAVGLAWWERVRSSSSSSSVSPSSKLHLDDRRWWSRGITALKKIREWSEIVAGPKWKTFLRRFNRNRGVASNRHGQFQYDPLSYALNFDEGHGQNSVVDDEDDFGGFAISRLVTLLFPVQVVLWPWTLEIIIKKSP
ncbi:hypothetical protein K2173_028106 [Erythroxylum novogranatense]|uniref:Uncharacterized protein n=1 Tax=Erythroxylum novogranatense TaxID=1862640 RepID=A0AAV8U3X2_9ROSI|nr:hypothetical protein K2173_028106 [Erythroxylum novogranatense]